MQIRPGGKATHGTDYCVIVTKFLFIFWDYAKADIQYKNNCAEFKITNNGLINIVESKKVCN